VSAWKSLEGRSLKVGDSSRAGGAQRRAAGVMSMFADPEVAMVLPANGGSGAGHLVDLLDYGLIRSHPKVFTGFSNPTVLINSVLAGAGLACAHGVTGFQFYSPAMHEPWTDEAFWEWCQAPSPGRRSAVTNGTCTAPAARRQCPGP
jgi:muramoyltetrapeptide carboxypeptidase LdcA involved in peptidoglycan recycling